MYYIPVYLLAVLLMVLAVSANNILLFQIEGEVGRENFTYYSINYGGNLLLELTSLQGDADIYITSKNILPGYEVDSYDLHSATCGVDPIYVPRNFKRPISVGIFGHPAHELSHFTLNVYQLPLTADPQNTNFEIDFNTYSISMGSDGARASIAKPESRPEPADSREVVVDEKPKVPRREETERIEERVQGRRKVKTFAGRTGLWAFLEIFEMIFL